jgi:hypothetical protein
MKKIIYLIISLSLLTGINSCTGYEPIFSSTELQLEIIDHSIKGNKKLGNKIYSRLHRAFKSDKNNPNNKTASIIIEVSKDQDPTVKNSAGKILEYKIVLKTNIILKDFLTNSEILNYNVSSSSSYKVQDKYSETKKVEDQVMNNLINKIYQDLLIKISEIALTK